MSTTPTLTEASPPVDVEVLHGPGVYPSRGIAIVEGRGARVRDADGREWIDLASGHGVANLGHAHPALVTAIQEQAGTLVTCPATYANDRRAALYERLAAVTPGDLDRFFLCNSGTEAVEAALKFARISTGRPGIVAMRRGFHGRTLGALSATWDRKYRQPFAPLVPGVTHVTFGSLHDAVEAITEETACVLVEVVQGEGGVHPATTEYLVGLRGACSARGALLIIDEVQTGFGRTGQLFACEHHELVPDLLCMGKAIAGGVPMGAVAIGSRVGALPPGSHGSTFGGNALACAAALATLDVLEQEELVRRARVVGASILEHLSAIDTPVVREVRGMGMMIGVELKQRATPYLRALMDRGVLALPAGPTVLRLLPPLNIDEQDLEQSLDVIEQMLVEGVA